MKRLLVIISLFAAVLMSACGAAAPTPVSGHTLGLNNPNAKSFGGGAPVPAESAAQAAPPNVVNDALAQTANNGGPTTSTDQERLVVQTAELTIVVQDVKGRVGQLEELAKTMGGYVVSVNIGQTYAPDGTQQPEAQIVIRVPADQLDAALSQVKQNTLDVQDETRSGQDITNQYVDLQSRLTAKQAAADQLTKIMQNASSTQDVLDVYQQLQQVDSDIEVLKGQIQYDQQAAQLSAITVHVVSEQTVKPIQVGGWQPQGTARDAIQNLVYFWQGFGTFLINFFLYVLPVLITIAIPLLLVFLLVRWLWRMFSRRKPKADAVKS